VKISVIRGLLRQPLHFNEVIRFKWLFWKYLLLLRSFLLIKLGENEVLFCLQEKIQAFGIYELFHVNLSLKIKNNTHVQQFQ